MVMPAHERTEKSTIVCKSLHSYYKGNQDKIANAMNLCPKTLRAYYRDILDGEIQSVDESVENSLLYQINVLHIPASTIFYLKTRMPHKYHEPKDAPEITPQPLNITFEVNGEKKEIVVKKGIAKEKTIDPEL